jgi:hypothetical protein
MSGHATATQDPGEVQTGQCFCVLNGKLRKIFCGRRSPAKLKSMSIRNLRFGLKSLLMVVSVCAAGLWVIARPTNPTLARQGMTKLEVWWRCGTPDAKGIRGYPRQPLSGSIPRETARARRSRYRLRAAVSLMSGMPSHSARLSQYRLHGKSERVERPPESRQQEAHAAFRAASAMMTSQPAMASRRALDKPPRQRARVARNCRR